MVIALTSLTFGLQFSIGKCCSFVLLNANSPMSAEHDTIRLIWSYLTQPLFGPGYKSLNPARFWRLYRIEQLEATWVNSPELEMEVMDELLEFLETCWLKNDLKVESHLNIEFIQFLERCWVKNLSKPNGYFNSPDSWSDEEEYH